MWSVFLSALFAASATVALARGLPEAKAGIFHFDASPFPYRGKVPDTQLPFLDVAGDTRSGHTSPRGGVYWEDQTYNDRRVLISIPKGFTLRRPVLLIVYFHGNSATIERDVIGRQRIAAQVAASGLNAVLVAPQFAVNALDSSAGNFWTPGFFAQFLDEAAAKTAELIGAPDTRAIFAQSPVVLVAYSGGYNPAAFALSVGGAGDRIKGVMLFDALYGETDKFASWIGAQGKSAFFFSAYSASSQVENTTLATTLRTQNIPFGSEPPRRFTPGSVSFLYNALPGTHDEFMTNAWVANPLAWSLARIPGFGR